MVNGKYGNYQVIHSLQIEKGILTYFGSTSELNTMHGLTETDSLLAYTSQHAL